MVHSFPRQVIDLSLVSLADGLVSYHGFSWMVGGLLHLDSTASILHLQISAARAECWPSSF